MIQAVSGSSLTGSVTQVLDDAVILKNDAHAKIIIPKDNIESIAILETASNKKAEESQDVDEA